MKIFVSRRALRPIFSNHRLHSCCRFPDAVQRETLRRRAGIVPDSACATIPVLQRITIAREDARERAGGAALRPGNVLIERRNDSRHEKGRS